MRAQTFPTLVIGITAVVFAVLLIYSIISLVNAPESDEKNVSRFEDATLDDLSLLSFIQESNSDNDCPYTEGPDADNDGVFDMCDNCPDHYNPTQEDSDNDGRGDACDSTSRSSGRSSGGGSESKGECSANLECGTPGYLEQSFCIGNRVAQNFVSFTCLNPGTKESTCIQNITVNITQVCDNTCQNGTCVDITCTTNADCNDNNSSTEDICVNPGTPQSECIHNPLNITCSFDSQCGTDGFIGSVFCSGDSVAQSYANYTCLNPSTTQSSCSLVVTNRTKQLCEDTCIAGSCVTIECYNNSECDDGNSSTEDICVHSSTPQSHCIHNPLNITCFHDSQCGTDGFVGDPFCLGLDIFRKFRTWDCVNPGIPQSYCNFSEQNRLLRTCEEACVIGACQDIDCFTNQDCGIDGYVEDPFCIGDNIYRMFEEFMCVFPGLPGSYCSSELTPQFTDECDYACLSGTCIRCDENSDCNDYNPDTNDYCILGGTPFSYCENVPIQTCHDECSSSGSRECSGSGYRICGDYDADSCLEWSQVTQCFLGEICSSGFCVQTCHDECIYGQRRCAGSGYQVCGDYDSDECLEWSQITQCFLGQVCVSGVCN